MTDWALMEMLVEIGCPVVEFLVEPSADRDRMPKPRKRRPSERNDLPTGSDDDAARHADGGPAWL